MNRSTPAYRRLAGLLVAVPVLLGAGSAVAAPPRHTGVVGSVPSSATPNITNGSVRAIYDAGSKVVAVGTFTTAQNRNSTTTLTRRYILAFDKATGAIDPAFVPAVDNEVYAVTAGPTPGTVTIAGRFNTVNGVNRRKVAAVNLTDGSLVTSFAPPAFNGAVNDVVQVGGRLLVGGIFTLAGTATRNGLASLNATTGALDSYLAVSLTGNHNYTGQVGEAQAGVGAEKLAASPDGTRLVAIGNFKRADGVAHDQVVKLDLGPTATIADWNTDRYAPRCAYTAFDSYMRDVAFSPDGAYFVIVTTGAAYSGTLCDAAARWEAAATGAAQQPTWVAYTGGDTLLATTVTERAVYVGGHIRWINNSFGADAAAAGAVGRPSIAALDPVNGLPLAWNPGRHPRGVGVTELYATPDGLWFGSDTTWMGNYQYRRDRIAFLPLAGGYAPHPTSPAALPGKVYQAGNATTNVLHRVNAGGPLLHSLDAGPDWAADTAASPSPYRNGGSNEGTYSPINKIDSTVPASTPAGVFTDERWDPGAAPEMHWGFPVAAGTAVQVRLYFANRCSCTAAARKRTFNVAIDGATVLTNYDVVASVGHNVGTMRSWTITSDGTVDIDFAHVVENPLIDAIEIVKSDGTQPGAENNVYARTYDGATGVGPLTAVANPDNTRWSTARGAFWVGGTLFYAVGTGLYRRSFDGTSFGSAAAVDPYHDPYWDAVLTNSGPTGQTYAGVTSNFYAEIPSVSGMFYSDGKLYYSLTGQSGLFWRWFTPDSGVVGADKITVAGASGFTDVGGLFASGNQLYLVSRSTGSLSMRSFAGGVPGVTSTMLSGPAVDGQDWRGRAVFVGP